MGVLERRERERLRTRNLILDAARELFTKHGVEATTMRAIAERIEYTPTAIYHHFRDKDELILELCDRDFRTFFQAVVGIREIADPVERLRRMGMLYVEFGLQNPEQYRFIFMTPKAVEVEHKPEESAYELLRQTAADGIAAGAYRPEHTDADQVAQIAWAGVHGVVSLPIAKKESSKGIAWKDTRDNAHVMIDVMLNGLLRETRDEQGD